MVDALAVRSLEGGIRQNHEGGIAQVRSGGGRGAGVPNGFIARPMEFGAEALVDTTPDRTFNCNLTSLEAFAHQLGA